MYVRHKDFKTLANVNEKEINEKEYLLPHLFKYVAWFIVIAAIVTSSVLLMIYGMSFGVIKSYIWLTGFFSSFIVSLFLIVPIRIFFFAIIKSIFMKNKPLIIRRKITPLLLSNPEVVEKKKQVLRFRQYNAKLYNPTPSHKLQNRLDDIKYNLELRNLTVNVLLYFGFMLAGCCIVLINKTSLRYYTNDVIVDDIVNGSYTNSPTFNEICTYEKFLRYLNETFLPALFSRENKSADEFETSNETQRRSIFDRGWTANPDLKLLGRPRFRQIRVQKDSCKYLWNLEGRNEECAAELNLFNVETGNFSLNWDPYSPNGLTSSQMSPWIYQSGWETATLPVCARFSSYPAGGYILELARNIDDSKIVLEYLNTFQWMDMRTRVVFIEFTLYCVNTNLFSIVTLIAERPANGYIIPSYQIETCKFMLLDSEVELFSLTMLVLFSFTLLVLIMRESLMVYRISFKLYARSAFALIDLTIVICGLISLLFVILRSAYVSRLIKDLETAENNKFVSFYYAAFWNTCSLYIEGFLVCLAPVKLFHLLTFRVHFLQIQTILNQCYKQFIDLYFLQTILIIAFALFFNITLAKDAEGFSTFGLSFSTMIGRSVALDDNFDFSVFVNNSNYLNPLFFGLFVVLFPILVVNSFIAVICLYFQKIQHTTYLDKYNFSGFIRHYMTISRQKDILRLKPVKANDEKKTNTDIMRLKGGGNRMAMKKCCRKEERQEKTKFFQVKLEDFVTEKKLDLTLCLDLERDRELAMRNLMILLLTDDEGVMRILSENSLRTLFYSYITERKSLNGKSGEYFLVKNKSTQEIFNKTKLPEMKKIVEDVGREKSLIEEDEADNDEVALCESKLSDLEDKLCLLSKKLMLIQK